MAINTLEDDQKNIPYIETLFVHVDKVTNFFRIPGIHYTGTIRD